MQEQYLAVQRILDETLDSCPNDINILEAGCGSISYFRFNEKAHITGIDISERQLSRNRSIEMGVVGDIQVYDFQPSSFDVVICWNVLEHVQHPELALDKFVNAVKENGLIILGLPNLLSVKGLLAKYTPHLFHVWIYKYLFKHDNPGEDDRAPFKTILSYKITPNAIRRFARRNGLGIVYFSLYEPKYYVEKLGILFLLFKKLFQLLSFGILGDSDFVIVIKKLGARFQTNLAPSNQASRS